MALSLSDALEQRATRIVRDLSILAPQPISGTWSTVRSSVGEAAVRATPGLPELPDGVDRAATSWSSLPISLEAQSGVERVVGGPEDAGPCIEREATGMDLSQTDQPTKPFREVEPAGGSKSRGLGADGIPLTASCKVPPAERGGSDSGIAHPAGGLPPQYGRLLQFRNTVAEATFGEVFARHHFWVSRPIVY